MIWAERIGSARSLRELRANRMFRAWVVHTERVKSRGKLKTRVRQGWTDANSSVKLYLTGIFMSLDSGAGARGFVEPEDGQILVLRDPIQGKRVVLPSGRAPLTFPT
jgi:hypothetical protein